MKRGYYRLTKDEDLDPFGIWVKGTIVFYTPPSLRSPASVLMLPNESLVVFEPDFPLPEMEPVLPTLDQFLSPSTLNPRGYLERLLEKGLISMQMLIDIEREAWSEYFGQRNLTTHES